MSSNRCGYELLLARISLVCRRLIWGVGGCGRILIRAECGCGHNILSTLEQPFQLKANQNGAHCFANQVIERQLMSRSSRSCSEVAPSVVRSQSAAPGGRSSQSWNASRVDRLYVETASQLLPFRLICIRTWPVVYCFAVAFVCQHGEVRVKLPTLTDCFSPAPGEQNLTKLICSATRWTF